MGLLKTLMVGGDFTDQLSMYHKQIPPKLSAVRNAMAGL